jgi:hypothetical protein
MRKYVVPIVALMGFALLTPRSEAANLVMKSRVGTPGRPVSMPVSVTDVGGTTQLWGLDFSMKFDATKLSAGTDPGGNGSAFSPQAITGSTEVPVVVSGTTFVGTVKPNPNLYVGIVRGTSAFTTTKAGNGQPNAAIGLLRLAVAAGAVKGTTVALTVPTDYNVANTGDGSTTNSRLGATGATSDTAAGAAVTAEAITVLNTEVGSTATNAVPLHTVAIGAFPGDVIVAVSPAVDAINSADIAKLGNYIVGKTTMTDYQKIAGDVAPLNGYTTALYGGTAGLSYGDGILNSADIALVGNKVVGKAAIFPVSE